MQRDATLVRSLLLCTHTALMPRESIYSDLHIWFPDIVMSQLHGIILKQQCRRKLGLEFDLKSDQKLIQ